MSRIAFALGLLGVVGLVGCGTSGTAVPGGSGTDSGVTAQPDGSASGDDNGVTGDAGVDADLGDDSGSSIYPATHYPMPTMTNFGGPVIASPKMITVTYVGQSLRDQLRAFDDAITSTPWWTSVTNGYGIGPGTSGGYAELADTVSNTTLDDDKDIVPMIQTLVDQGKLPRPDANTLYAFYFPASTTITLEGDTSCQAFGAYHSSAVVTLEGGTVDAAYAIMPDCSQGQSSMDAFTGAASHEFIEAATDPHPLHVPTFYMWNDAWATSLGGEVADICEGRGTIQEGNYAVSKSWVNAAALGGEDPCQPGDTSKIFFSAALATESLVVDRDTPNEHLSDSYVLLHPGATKTLDVVVYSKAALAHDLQIIVGTDARGSQDVTAVGPITSGVTATLSRATGTNGTKITLTLTADTTVNPGDYPFVVRALYDGQNDYHSWHAVLHVI